MTPRPVSVPNPVQAHTILERSVCLTLDRHWLGNDRKVGLRTAIAAATDAAAPDTLKVDEKQLRVTMKLIDQKELRPCMQVMSRAGATLKARAISAHRIFGERTYLIPRSAVEDVDQKLQQLQFELELEAAALADRYAAAVEKQREALGSMFDAKKYLTNDQVRDAWGLEWRYVSFAAPENLETISSVLAERERAKYETQLTDAFNEVTKMLRSEALTIVEDLETRLTPGPDGMPKVLRGTALRDLQTYISFLPSRNMTDDAALPAALENVRRLTEGLSVQTLRDNDILRDRVRAAATAAKAQLAALVETEVRGISLTGMIE